MNKGREIESEEEIEKVNSMTKCLDSKTCHIEILSSWNCLLHPDFRKGKI